MIPSLNRRFLCAGVLVAVVALLAVPAASAQESFSGKACSLFTASQVAKIVGDTSSGKYSCVAGKSAQTPAGTTYTAKSGSGTTAGGGFFSILVVKYKSASYASLARNQVKRGLKPVSGIGDWAYGKFATSPMVGGTVDAGELAFSAHGYGVLITVRAKLKNTVNQPALKTLAKHIVGEL